MEGGKLTLEILQEQMPYMGFDDAAELLKWFLTGSSPFIIVMISQDDNNENYFMANISREFAEEMLNGDR